MHLAASICLLLIFYIFPGHIPVHPSFCLSCIFCSSLFSTVVFLPAVPLSPLTFHFECLLHRKQLQGGIHHNTARAMAVVNTGRQAMMGHMHAARTSLHCDSGRACWWTRRRPLQLSFCGSFMFVICLVLFFSLDTESLLSCLFLCSLLLK